jgi:DNA topoisomerase I
LQSRYLVITEKPSSARKIAYSLDDSSSPRKGKYGKVSFYVAEHKGDELVIVSAVGHLYTIEQKKGGWSYPVYDIEWVPTYESNKKLAYTKQYLDAIIGLANKIDGYVSACDYDQEGSLIAFNIIKHGIGDQALTKARRMLYSTLTSKELVSAWEHISPSLDYSVVSAGKTRHETDWLFGINLSRALTLAARRFLDFKKVLSIGRVQGPALKFVYDLEQSIQSFIPTPYWKVYAETEIEGETYSLDYEKQTLKREIHARDVARECRGKKGKVNDIDEQSKNIAPPSPFNLGDLQNVAYKHFKMNPSNTLKAAEKLYLGAYISYPRTESNKIPKEINVKEILEKLSKNREYEEKSKLLLGRKRFKPKQGKGEDPAHPAIYPTGQRPRQLKKEEKNIYDLIVKRFMASLGEDLIQVDTTVSIDVKGHTFYLRGILTQKTGWTQFYGEYHKLKDQRIPKIEIGQILPITSLSTRRRYTRPSSRFNPSSLVRKMEQEDIGTKATRSNIIDTLYQRGYVKSNKIKITELGEVTIETLQTFCPDIIKVEFTRILEKELKKIEENQKDPDKVFSEAMEELKSILEDFKKNEEQIGRSISNTILGKRSLDCGESCKVCNRDKLEDSVFCQRHTDVYNRVEDEFQKWRYALGYQWVEYLEKLNKLSGTGGYVKEVIKFILR